jgi:ribosome-associated protein
MTNLSTLTNLPTPTTTAQAIHPAVLAASDPSEKLAFLVADAADDRKGGEITLIKIGDVSVLADYFVIVTGFSKVQVRAIASSITDKVEEVLGQKARSMQGQNDGSWVLVDYGDVVAHVMMPEEREYYNLEAFWGHGELIPFDGKAIAAAQNSDQN